MITSERAQKQDRLLRALRGLNRKAFDELMPRFSAVYEQFANNSYNNKVKILATLLVMGI
ncbi:MULTISPECIES: hypothetical protein [Moorena]|uniref:Uncharacterized protein n=1 Tax=Moorena producens 3L TaxID=489825 RepID=F4XN58_9CYAN|nr:MULTISPECIES: hypothetical protein [Moorena]EGJ34117.1 hypothetical protein LYNGBM3L_23420 [Moorena producens 3L]OLT65088.1 hypothetical protein BI334_08615 [Moorena producens 3L]